MSRHHRRGGEVPPHLKRIVLHRADYACQRCGKRGRKLECDHIIPLAQLGSKGVENLQALCVDCHHEKTQIENGVPVGARQWAKFVNRNRRRAV